MIRFLIFLVLITITSCQEQDTEVNIDDYKVSTKFCVAACVKTEFRLFHTGNGQFLGGSSSSSMGGIGDTSIYQKVYAKCEEFYSLESCCKWSPYNTVHNNHGGNYGMCKE